MKRKRAEFNGMGRICMEFGPVPSPREKMTRESLITRILSEGDKVAEVETISSTRMNC
jgi:hypothetical protein